MGFDLSETDRERLRGVHPDLVRVVERAAAMAPPELRFRVVEGLRSIAQQRINVARGASKTMNSRHIRAPNGFGHAVDLVVFDGHAVDWSWPVTRRLAAVVKAAAKAERVPLEWGGDWREFTDGPHWQLPWKQYPGAAAEVADAPPMTDGRRTALFGSRVVQGSAAGVGGGVAQLVATGQDAQDHFSTGTVLGYVLGAVIIAGALYAAWSAWDDAGRPGLREILRGIG
jgi:peptidoglycan L-alanyl-D-glutamate endopeptidase CwlK